MNYCKGLTNQWKKVGKHVLNNMKLKDPEKKKLEQDADLCRAEIMGKNKELGKKSKSAMWMGKKRGA